MFEMIETLNPEGRSDASAVEAAPPATLSVEQVDTLLRLLSTDRVFREQFERDAAVALASIGVEREINCMQPRKLASIEAITMARQEIRDELLNGKLGLIPNMLDATWR